MTSQSAHNPYAPPQECGGEATIGRRPLIALIRIGQLLTLSHFGGLWMLATVFAVKTATAPGTGASIGLLPGVGGDVALPVLGALVAVAACVAAVRIPSGMRRAALQELSELHITVDWHDDSNVAISEPSKKVFQRLQAATTVGQLILLGSGALTLVLMALDGRLFYLAIVVVCALGILVQMPTLGKWRKLVESSPS